MTYTRPSQTAAVLDEKASYVAASPYQFKNYDPHSSHSVMLRLLGHGENRRLLDVGAAHGYLAQALRAQGFHVTGLEGDSVLAEEAAKHCNDLLVQDLDAPLPRFDCAFDAMVFGDVLEHLKDPLNVLRTLLNDLHESGLVVISLPNIANVYVRLRLLLGRFDYQDRGILDRTHLRFFTRKTFREFLADAGLDVEQLTATPIPLPLVVPRQVQGGLFRAAHGMNAWLARVWPTLFGYQFIAVARKRRLHAA